MRGLYLKEGTQIGVRKLSADGAQLETGGVTFPVGSVERGRGVWTLNES